ncbi:MAG: T9SS type A sorting domain-containing protein, partial [Bacteroidales bacterium]|nr:T9SS type A sorting domain-containing protein [Bacteroidales bacterium]
VATGTSFTADATCGGGEHNDATAQTCESPTIFATKNFEINVVESEQVLPVINTTDIEAEYTTEQDIELTATINSNGLIDELCGMGYEVYKDDEIIENISDFGSLNYKFRLQDEEFYNGTITQGSGMIEIQVGEDTFGAFTLGIFDTYCIDRNRPINVTANFNETGTYKFNLTLYYCENDGVATGTSFTADATCGGGEHNDATAQTCESPTIFATKNFEINVVAADEITIISQSESTSICEGSSTTISVDATANNSLTINYKWYKDGTEFGNTTNAITVDAEGDYYCELTAGTASATTETISITYHPTPSISLNPTTPMCSGEAVVLNPGEFASYEWSDNSTEPTLSVTEAGNYSVTVTDEFGCTATASTVVTAGGEMPEEFSFTDTTICYGITHALEGPFNETYTYLWNTEDTTYSIIVEEAGTYSLTVTNTDGCKREGSVNIDFAYTVNAQIAGGDDEVHSCSDAPNVRLGPIPEGSSWLWSNESTSRTIRVTTPGIYWVVATDTATGCIGTDTVELFIHQIPEVNLGDDQAYCAEETRTLTVQADSCQYAWNTGETTQSLTIEKSGFYAVTVTDEFGCWAKDSLNIEIYPMPVVDLGDDFEMYENYTAILTAGYGCISYVWSLGPEYTEHFVILSADNLNFGTNVISVTAITVNGCEDSDQVTVTLHQGVNAEIEKAEMFDVYPNPTTGIIKINAINIENISLYDSLGRLVFSTESDTIDMSSFANGNYTLKVLTQDNSYSTKIVKQ